MNATTYLKISTIILLINVLLQPAYAIPPPDAIMSLWQSALQFLGMISVVLAGAALAIRQFWTTYLIGWKRYLALATLIIGTLGSVFWWFNATNPNTPVQAANTPNTDVIPPAPQAVLATPPKTPITTLPIGEHIAVTDIIKRDKDEYTRNWKLNTLKEMEVEAQEARYLAQLPPLKFNIINSFTPKVLQETLKQQRNKLYMLDVREDYEQTQVSITQDATARYGDLVHDIIPKNLPHDKTIILICHSGIRGYIAANTLLAKGYNNIAFLQGGVGAWNDAKLPLVGNADYSLKPKSLKVLSPEQFKKVASSSFKVQIDTTAPVVKNVKDLAAFPYETASTPMLQKLYQQAGTKPVVLICNSYGGCFHGLNLSYLLKQAGKNYVGIYDASKQWLNTYND